MRIRSKRIISFILGLLGITATAVQARPCRCTETVTTVTENAITRSGFLSSVFSNDGVYNTTVTSNSWITDTESAGVSYCEDLNIPPSTEGPNPTSGSGSRLGETETITTETNCEADD